MTRPKLFLVPVDTLRGNRAHEWHGTTGAPERRESRRRGDFWLWLVNLTREAARTGSQVRPGGRAGW